MIRDEIMIKGIQCDYESIKKQVMNLRDELKYLNEQVEVIGVNLGCLLTMWKIPLKSKEICSRCKGYGTVYISPICDMGQGNKCPACGGDGFLWE